MAPPTKKTTLKFKNIAWTDKNKKILRKLFDRNTYEELIDIDIMTQNLRKTKREIIRCLTSMTNKPTKKIYTQETRTAGRLYNNAMRKFHNHQTPTTTKDMKIKQKEFKRLRRRDIRRHQRWENKHFTILSKCATHELWSSVNPIPPQEALVIPTNILTAHINKLYADELGEIKTQLILMELDPPNHDHLDHVLCKTITQEEIYRCVTKHTSNRRAVGQDGIPSELLKYGNRNLHTQIAHNFTKILHQLQYPKEWKRGQIIALFKKGDKMDAGNYRTITINSSLAKLYSTVLTQRLQQYVDNQLCDAQFGFRPRRSTITASYVATTAIRDALQKKKELVIIFVDFSKAFDTVKTAALLKKLYQFNIPPHFIRAIADMYSNITATLSGDDNKQLINIQKGVKQGDPMSPLLFCLFLNDIETYLRNHGCTGIRFGNQELMTLLYADDTTLFANSPSEATKMMNLVISYCAENDLLINISKTQAMHIPLQNSNTLDFIPSNLGNIPTTETFRFLGTMLSTKNMGPMEDNVEERKKQGRRAMYTFRAWRARYPAVNPHIAKNILDALVSSVLTYGIELTSLDPHNTKLRGLSAIRNDGLRLITQVPKMCHLDTLHGELHTIPLQEKILIAQIRLLLRLKAEPKTSLLGAAYNIDQNNGRMSWSRRVERRIQKLEIHIPPSTPLTKVAQIVETKYWDDWEIRTKTLTPPSRQIHKIAHTLIYQPPWYITNSNLTKEERRCIARLRTGLPQLFVNAKRISPKPAQELMTSFCPMCGDHTLEDEAHFLLHCPHYSSTRQPVIDHIRPNGKDDEERIRFILNCTEHKIVKFIRQMVTRRELDDPEAKSKLSNVKKQQKRRRGYHDRKDDTIQRKKRRTGLCQRDNDDGGDGVEKEVDAEPENEDEDTQSTDTAFYSAPSSPDIPPEDDTP
jgi:hypothetical protein